MQTLKLEIPIPEGYEIDTVDKKSGEIRFIVKPTSIFERIKTLQDVLADQRERNA